VIVVSAGVAIWHWSTFRQDAQAGAHHTNLQLDLACRYSMGYALISNQQTSRDNMAAQVRAAAKSPLDELRVVPVIAELQGKPAGAREAARFVYERLPDQLTTDGKTLEEAYLNDGTNLTADTRQQLEDRYGWYGQLAVSQFSQPGDATRIGVERAAKRTFFAVVTMICVVVALLIAGFVLCIVGLVLRTDGKLLPAYLPGDPAVAGALVEGFAVYLLLMASLSVLDGFLPSHPGRAWNLLLLVPVLAAVGWVRLCRVSRQAFAEAVGWNAGRGFIREIFCGILGYIAGLPLIAVGIWTASYLARFSQTKAVHPLDFEIEAGGWIRILLIFLACVFAPITEELMFRGMFLRHLTARFPRWVSVIVVSIIFAAIHPQGWTVLPALGSIGAVLAMIRLQRDSLVASMTAHAMNNSLLVAFLIFATG